MPESEHVKAVVLRLVVDEVTDAAEKEATHLWRSRPLLPCADARLLSQQGDGLAKVGTDGTRGGRTVCRPPLGSVANLTCCSG